MTKIIYSRYDKKHIADLPVVQFDGRIVVVLSKREAEQAVKFLLTQPLLGFDTETKPSFRRGQVHKVSLLQVATPTICFLFRLNYTGLAPVVPLLEDTTVKKIGLSWHDDLNSLHQIGTFNTGTFIDIQSHVKEIGVEDMSLQKLYANLFGQKISKRQQLSNWEADVLDERQKLYAATDAWACIMIYNELVRLTETRDYKLIVQED